MIIILYFTQTNIGYVLCRLSNSLRYNVLFLQCAGYKKTECLRAASYLHSYGLWWRKRYGYNHPYWRRLNVHLDIFIVQEYYGIFPFYFSYDAHCGRHPTYAVHNRIYSINTAVCICVCMCVLLSLMHMYWQVGASGCWKSTEILNSC
jgi:hypothetical protein